jgi:hypothetical protein
VTRGNFTWGVAAKLFYPFFIFLCLPHAPMSLSSLNVLMWYLHIPSALTFKNPSFCHKVD